MIPWYPLSLSSKAFFLPITNKSLCVCTGALNCRVSQIMKKSAMYVVGNYCSIVSLKIRHRLFRL